MTDEMRAAIEARLKALTYRLRTTSGIARRLLAAGCKLAHRYWGGSDCPTALWLNADPAIAALMPEGYHIHVSTSAVYVVNQPGIGYSWEAVELPDLQKQFIREFDSGLHKELRPD